MSQQDILASRPTPQVQQDPSDQELVERIRRSDQTAFNLLYDRYFPRIYGFTQARMRNRADAEEVVQEIFMAVYRSIEAYRGQSTLLAWIYGIAKNTINNHIRRSKAHEQRIERAESELLRSSHTLDSCTPEEHLSLRRCEKALQEKLGSVAEWHAEVFFLRHFENLSIGEISVRVRRSNDAVRSSLYRMKRTLMEAVDATPAA